MDSMCPLCKSTRKTVIHVSGPREYASIHIHGWSGMNLYACADCGTVYIPQAVREAIQESFDKEKPNA